jgi:DNA-binding IscR family transcriptional regulator
MNFPASLNEPAVTWPTAEELVLAYLQEHSDITNAQARVLTDISSGIIMMRVFCRLRKRGLIKRVEGPRGNIAAWQRV